MSQPVVLVTGSSSGIGLAASVAAAQNGFMVIATMRDTSKSAALLDGAAAAGVSVTVRQLDVVSADSVDRCLAGVAAEFGRLDALVNNAGAAYVGTLEVESIQAVRAAMEVNFFGVVQVSKAAMPHLRQSRGRLITVSSVGGAVGQPFNESYCAAKFAVEGYMESLAPVAAQVGVRVTIIEPGAVASEFVANAKLNPVALLAAAGPYASALQSYIRRTMSRFGEGAQTPAAAAESIIAALTMDDPPLRIQTSDWARTFVGRKLVDLDGSAVLRETTTWVSAPSE